MQLALASVVFVLAMISNAWAEPALVEWTREDWSDECTELTFELPSSLVPIRDVGAATMGIEEFHSFDERLTLSLGPEKQYLDSLECGGSQSALGINSIYGGETQPEFCETGRNRVLFGYRADEIYGIETYCNKILVIAPDQVDESNFVVFLEMCGGVDQANLIKDVARRIWSGAQLNYLGCCRKGVAYAGCNWAPSFDCKRQLVLVENMICKDKELAGLDNDLSIGFDEAMGVVSGKKKKSLVAAQRAWIKSRNGCAKLNDMRHCIRAIYLRRIQQLHHIVYPNSPPGSWRPVEDNVQNID